MINVACVIAGNKYSRDYVYNLYNAIKRNLSLPYHFYVFSDIINIHNLNTLDNMTLLHIPPLPKHPNRTVKLWWHKMEMFNPAYNMMYNKTLYFDLDTVITGDITKLATYPDDKFCICQDFNRHGRKDFYMSNSSVMKFGKQDEYLYHDFMRDYQTVVQQNQGDQNYLTSRLGSDKHWWPYEWVMSYRWELLDGGLITMGNQRDPNNRHKPGTGLNPPEECSVIVFHGSPDPHEVLDEHELIKENWR